MKSHILLPSKVQDSRKEAASKFTESTQKSSKEPKKEGKKTKLFSQYIRRPSSKVSLQESGEQSPVFEIAKENSDVMEFSKAIEDFNKDLIDDVKSQGEGDEIDHPMLFHTRSDQQFNRNKFRHNMHSVIERDENLLEDIYRESFNSNYSIGDDIRTSNDRSEVSETTKNINASYDDDISNRKEEIEASIESLEFKAITLLHDDEMMLKLCKEKVKEYFDKCMDNDNTSDEDIKKYIHSMIQSKQNQSPAVGDLNSFEKINEIVTILSKIQYQLLELKNM
jgi:hypothetical protein